jgi:glycosyltransferase involved in cell wall biosynthesis
VTGPALSVVIPVHNEAGLLERSVAELCAGLDAMAIEYEVILAENGSVDATPALAAAISSALPRVRCFSIAAPNYGRALRLGIEQARGFWVICEEIDLCDLDFHRRALALLRAGEAELVIGSKAMRGALDQRPLHRRLATRAYNLALRLTLGFRGTDTHGLKAMRRAALAPVVARCIVDADVFASELVIRAQREGVRIREIPVALAEKRAPSVHLLRRVPKVLRLLLRLWLSIHLGRAPASARREGRR